MFELIILLVACLIDILIILIPAALIIISIIKLINQSLRTGKKESIDFVKHNDGKVNPKYLPKNNKVTEYPSGWKLNEKTQLWEPPEHLNHKEETVPKNQITEQGTYRFDYTHIPKEEIRNYRHTDTNITIKKEVVAPKQKNEYKAPDPTRVEHKVHEPTRVNYQNPTRPVNQGGTRSQYQKPVTPAYQQPIHQEKPKTGYEDAYEARQILSYNERRNYKTLLEAANRKGYTVQMKMHLADIIGPKTGDYHEKYYTANFRRISQHHADFAILNNRLKVVAVIELDDNSHDRPDRKARDEKIDSILEGTNIKIIHTRHITPDILDNL